MEFTKVLKIKISNPIAREISSSCNNHYQKSSLYQNPNNARIIHNDHEYKIPNLLIFLLSNHLIKMYHSNRDILISAIRKMQT